MVRITIQSAVPVAPPRLQRTRNIAIVPASLLCLVTLLAAVFAARPAQAEPAATS